MKRGWIKLYIGMIGNPVMGLLPDWLWRRAIELFLLAGENGDDGLLPPVRDMAWRLRTSEEKLTEALQALSQVGVVHETPQGWVVTNFKKRQAALTEAERAGRYRARRRSSPVAAAVTLSDAAAVTDSNSSSPPPGGEGAGGGGTGERDGRDDAETFKAVPPPPGYGEYLEEMRASRREKARRAARRSQDEPNSSDRPGQDSGPQPP